MNSVILHIYLQNTSIMSMQSIMCAEETVLQLKLTHAPFIAEENQSDRFIFLQELRLLSDLTALVAVTNTVRQIDPFTRTALVAVTTTVLQNYSVHK